LKRYWNDNDISKFRYFSWRYRYDTTWPISTRYIVWTTYRCITIAAASCYRYFSKQPSWQKLINVARKNSVGIMLQRTSFNSSPISIPTLSLSCVLNVNRTKPYHSTLGQPLSSSSSSSLYSPKEHSVTKTVNWTVGQDNMAAKKATLIVAREEKIKYTQNYTKLDKTIELKLDITKI